MSCPRNDDGVEMALLKVIAISAVLTAAVHAQVKPGAMPPETEWKSITQRALEDFRGKKVVVVFSGTAPEEISRATAELRKQGVEVLHAAPRTGGSFVWLLDEQGIIRRVEPLPRSAQGIADLVKEWELGKKAFAWGCPECHGENGNEGYNGAHSLQGIGRRLSREEIRTKLNATKVSVDRYSIRCCQFTGRELEALIVFVAGL